VHQAERLDAYGRSLSPEAVERELGHWSGLAGLPFDRLPFEPTGRTDPFDSFAPTAPLAPAASTARHRGDGEEVGRGR